MVQAVYFTKSCSFVSNRYLSLPLVTSHYPSLPLVTSRYLSLPLVTSRFLIKHNRPVIRLLQHFLPPAILELAPGIRRRLQSFPVQPSIKKTPMNYLSLSCCCHGISCQFSLILTYHCKAIESN